MANPAHGNFEIDGDYARALERSVGAGIVVRDRAGRVLHVSDIFCEMTGWSRHELLGTGVPAPYWADTERDSADRAFQRSLAGEMPLDGWSVTLKQRSGEHFQALAYVAPLKRDGVIVGLVTSIYDLSEQSAEVKRRRKAEERMRLALDVASIGMWRWELDSNTHIWTDECYKHLGLSRDVPIERDTFTTHVHPEDRDRVIAAVLRAIQTRQDYDEQYRVVRDDGSLAWIRGIGRVFYHPDGRPERVEGTTQDITLTRQRAQTPPDQLVDC